MPAKKRSNVPNSVRLPKTFKEGYTVGKRESKQQVKKAGIITRPVITKIKKIINTNLIDIHWNHHIDWKRGYMQGANDLLGEYNKTPKGVIKLDWPEEGED